MHPARRSFLRQYYPPSVLAALDIWFRKHPNAWPYERPEDLAYWLQCLKHARKRFSKGLDALNDAIWYANHGVLLPEA